MAASLSVSRHHSAQRMARNRQLQMYLSLRMRRVLVSFARIKPSSLVNVYSSSIRNQQSSSELRSMRLPPSAPTLPSRAESMRRAAEARMLSSHFSRPAAYFTSFFSAKYQASIVLLLPSANTTFALRSRR
jgi:hypothetical protein